MTSAAEQATLVAALRERLSKPDDRVEQSLITGGETGLDDATLRRWLRAERRVLRLVRSTGATSRVCGGYGNTDRARACVALERIDNRWCFVQLEDRESRSEAQETCRMEDDLRA